MFSVWKLLCFEFFVLLKSVWEVAVCICIMVFPPQHFVQCVLVSLCLLLFPLSFHHSLTASVCLCVYLCPQTFGDLGNFQQCELLSPWKTIDYISVCLILIKFKKKSCCLFYRKSVKKMQKKRSFVLSQQVTVTTVCTCLFCSVIITGNFTDSFSLHHINNGDFLFQPAMC